MFALTTWAIVVFLAVLPAASSQACENLQAVFSVVHSQEHPLSVLGQLADPQMNFYRNQVGFTEDEITQQRENAFEHFRTRFGLDFASVEPNEQGQWILGNATLYFLSFPFNLTIAYNRWVVNGRTTTRCFPLGIGGFEVDINGDMMLHGAYGGEEGIPVGMGDMLFYGHDLIYDACAQQPILILAYSDVPKRSTPVEGWTATDLVISNRQLGRGVVRGVTRFRFPPDRPGIFISETHEVYSFN